MEVFVLLQASKYVLLLILAALCGINADRTSLKIYESVQGDFFCFRRLNGTHQIGCSSKRGGNVGVIHLVEKESDLQWITEEGPNINYVAALTISCFNMGNMTALKNSNRVTGVLVLKEDDPPDSGFSSDKSCPGDNFGLYAGQAEYEHCKKGAWNPSNPALGMMYGDWPFPVFLMTNQTSISYIKEKCFEQFNLLKNGSSYNWPLCAAELKSNMIAAKDSVTCMRRSNLVTNLNPIRFCDPLSDKNIVGTLYPTYDNKSIPDRSVIVIGARMDAFSMFDNFAPGGDSAVTGLVTLLAIAHTLSINQGIIDEAITASNSTKKNVLFALFNGEAFDYIGSSRVVYEMKKEQFPAVFGPPPKPALIKLNHLSHFIELSQLAPLNPDKKIFVHVDPVTTKNDNTNKEVNSLIKKLKEADKDIEEADRAMPLPPASVQSFLKHDGNISAVVLTNHQGAFSNKFYNSIYDTSLNVFLGKNDSKDAASYLTKTAEAVVSAVYSELTGQNSSGKLKVNETLVSQLLECYLLNATCSLFREVVVVGRANSDGVVLDTLPLYVSVSPLSSSRVNAVSLVTRLMLAYLTGEVVQNVSDYSCKHELPNADRVYQYDSVPGPKSNDTEGLCIKSTVRFTIARSPAFETDDWASSEYSTWTESVWEQASVRLFLKPSRSQEVSTLIVGIIISLVSLAAVYSINKNAALIFTSKSLVGC